MNLPPEDPPAAVAVAVTTAEDRTVIGLAGEIDHATAAGMLHDVLALTDGSPEHLELDLSGVGFCDSSGMSALLSIWRHQHAGGGSLTLTATPGNIVKALRTGGLDQLLTIRPA